MHKLNAKARPEIPPPTIATRKAGFLAFMSFMQYLSWLYYWDIFNSSEAITIDKYTNPYIIYSWGECTMLPLWQDDVPT
ncbi:Uncharacterized protein KF715C_pA410 (plasmid) [Pseudomonas putida]|uniref:Uncharacterized protein n=1 Tax=Pseudomonas putida TaxID=303 RepID=A0A1L7NM48_PSEPU|nr:Uncharacterized protein KF715C_pA410 [Pseudomonas putida]